MPYKDPEKTKEHSRFYRKEHREELKVKKYQYNLKPEVKEHKREYSKQYRASHREHLNKLEREATRKYRLNHPQYLKDMVVKNRIYRQNLRKKVLTHFGSKCIQC